MRTQASNSIYDSSTTRNMLFKLMNAVIEACAENNGEGREYYIFDQDALERVKVGNFKIKTVQGKEEEVDLYLEPLSKGNGALASTYTKEENNGKMAVVMRLKDDWSMGEFMDAFSDQDFFSKMFSNLAHEITHAREAEAKPQAYSQEEDKRLHDLKKTDIDKYHKEYSNSEVEFESLVTTMISSMEGDLIGILVAGQRGSDKKLMEKIKSGELYKMVRDDLVRVMTKASDKFGWPVEKRRAALQKAYSGAEKIIESVKEFIQTHMGD